MNSQRNTQVARLLYEMGSHATRCLMRTERDILSLPEADNAQYNLPLRRGIKWATLLKAPLFYRDIWMSLWQSLQYRLAHSFGYSGGL